ncbi:MAG TPA: hypothetical protein VHM66_13515 [Solirubrobacterales bacterium]|nr:hypothetical protein [Solirubrobacterales bacterium]
MSLRPQQGSSRWLDSLARWSVRGRDHARPPADLGAGLSIVAAGTTRRTALRTAAGAGAVALLAPGRLLDPPAAEAITTPLAACQSASFHQVRGEFQKCVKNPLADFKDINELLAEKEEFLHAQKKPAARRRLKKLIAELNRRRSRALQDLEFCNAAFVQDRAEGEAQCQSSNGTSAENGGSGSGGKEGCEPGFLLCEEYCCNTANAYCQGCNGKIICCRIEADCCPNG